MQSAEAQTAKRSLTQNSRNAIAPAWWLAAMLSAAFFLPGMMSAFYLPKLAWAAITVAIGLLLAPPLKSGARKPGTLETAWTIYLLWAIASAMWAPSPRVVIDRWLLLVLLTCAYQLALRTRFWDSDAFWAPFWALIAVLCIVGFIQNTPAATVPDTWAWRLGGAIPSRGRPSITMGYRNQAAMFLALLVPFAFWRAFATPRRWVAALSLLAGILIMLFIVVVRTRSAWVGLAGGLSAVLALGLWRRLRIAPAPAFGVAAILAIALLVAPLNPGSPGPGGLMAKSVPRLKQSLARALMSIPRGSDEGRLEMWTLALKHLSPLGTGLGCLPMAIAPDRPKVPQLNWEIHNDYIQNLAELGAPGLLAFLAVLFALLRLAWQGRNQGVALAAGMAVVTLAVMLLFTFTSRKIDSLLWMAGIAAILTGIGRSATPQPDERAAAPWLARGATWALATGLVVYAAMASRAAWADHVLFRNIQKPRIPLEKLASDWMPALAVDTTVAHIQAHHYALLAVRSGQPGPALRFARYGLRIYPVDRSLYQIMAIAAFRQNRMIDAVRFQEKAVELQGPSPSAPSLERLAVYYAKAGLEKRSLETARRAREASAPQLRNYKPGKP